MRRLPFLASPVALHRLRSCATASPLTAPPPPRSLLGWSTRGFFFFAAAGVASAALYGSLNGTVKSSLAGTFAGASEGNRTRRVRRRGVALPIAITPLFDDPAVDKKIYGHLTEEYKELGQITRDEVGVTVMPHVFSQIGIVDASGVRSMCQLWLRALLPLARDDPARLFPAADVFGGKSEPKGVVFCDIGSGVGNVCLQVLGEVAACSKVVGIEVVPSRHSAAETAFTNAQEHYPQRFGSGKSAVFALRDLVGSGEFLREQGVNVLFSHSWMFDDDLMAKFAQTVKDAGPQLQCVITSRPFEVSKTDERQLLSADWLLAKHTSFSSDWNPESPFYVYIRAH